MARKPGGQTTLTKQIGDKIVEAVRKGHFHQTAASLVGVPPQTLSGWLVRGERETEGIYRELWLRVSAAEALAEDEVLNVIIERAKIDPKFAMAYAGRRWAQRWARHDNVTMHTPDLAADTDAGSVREKLVGKLTGLVAALRERHAEAPSLAQDASNAPGEGEG